MAVPVEWRCTFCRTWNRWFTRYCVRCLGQKVHMTFKEGDTR